MNRGLEDEQGVIPAAISIADVLRGMWHRKLFIFAMTTAAFLMSLSVVNVVKPVYTTEAQVLITDLETPFDQIQSVRGAPTQSSVSDRDLATQIAVIKSADIGRRVVAALSLDKHPSFNPLIGGIGTIGNLKLKLGFGHDPRLMTPEDLALDSLDESLIVYGIPSSNVIAIKVTAGSPKIAAEVANSLSQTYVASTREATTQPTERAQQWLAQQIDGLRNKVAASDQAVEQFRAEAGLFQGQTSTLGAQELSELNTQITQAAAAKSDAQSRADSIRNLLSQTGSVDASADVLASNVIQNLKQQQTEAQRNVAELSASYLSNHPKMIAAAKQLDNVNRRIRSEALRIVEGLEEQARIAEAREQSLRESLGRAKSETTTSNLDDVKLKALEREAQANRVLLETMLARYAEATARLDPSAHPGFARIIQTASAPAIPSFPKKGPLVVLISLAGLSLGLGLAFLLEMMAAATRLNERIFRAQSGDLEIADEGEPAFVRPQTIEAEAPQQPPAQWQPPPVAPQPIAALPLVLSAGSTAPGTEVNRVITWFDDVRSGLASPSLAITSLGGGRGDAASLALACARVQAARGKRTVVVDLVGDNGWFMQISGAPAGPGLADLVIGAADFTKVIVRDRHSAAHVLRYGQDYSGRASAVLADRLKPVLQALGQSYDAVLVNCGEAAPATPSLIRACGATVFMAPSHRAADVASAIATLKATGYAAMAHVQITPATEQEPVPQAVGA
jgi:uncharacterized protein involved in exopolysaccharide biosynthesis/Mrp family chromosome partitioning ATPase